MAGSAVVTTAVQAAFAMGMMAHSDETDDSHERAGMHPGCAIVPAALAVAQREGADGARFIRSVVAGYDIGCRMTQALGVQNVRSRALSLHGIGTNFGAAAAAASILGLKEASVRFVWDYSCQQDSGKYYWMRDRDHVEKAFVFAAMGARNGVTSALLVQSGFTGVDDAFSGENNYFESFGPGVNPGQLIEELGSRYEIQHTDIKKYSVGAPIQAPLDALLILRERHGLRAPDVEAITARVPDDRVLIVRDRDMPDVDLKHVLAVALIDGTMTFEASHSYERMKDPAGPRGPGEDHPDRATRGSGRQKSSAAGSWRSRPRTAQGSGSMSSWSAAGREILCPTRRSSRNARISCGRFWAKSAPRNLIDRIWNLEKVETCAI